jgi:serine/threonine protein kinase
LEENPLTLAAGTRLGRYEIRSKIGEGGMGEVYLAEDTRLDRKVALKLLPAEVATDNKRMSRFVQEAKTASGLNHPNIITIYEIESGVRKNVMIVLGTQLGRYEIRSKLVGELGENAF